MKSRTQSVQDQGVYVRRERERDSERESETARDSERASERERERERERACHDEKRPSAGTIGMLEKRRERR